MPREMLFSQRHETRRPETGLIYSEVPERVRIGLINIIDKITAQGLRYPDLPEQLLYALDYRAWSGIRLDRLDSLIKEQLDWDTFCDACQVIYEILRGSHADQFANEANALFVRNYFGYELRDGQMVRVGARVQDEAIAQARGILRDPDLSGPDQQFQKAVGFYNRRPEPDLENCVKEAVGAVEAVARVLLKDDSILLSKATARLKKEKDVHPTLVKLLNDLYAYRGDAEGVAHGMAGEKEVGREEAELALGVSASAIVYLARLYGRGVE